jgi:hypothetical protein
MDIAAVIKKVERHNRSGRIGVAWCTWSNLVKKALQEHIHQRPISNVTQSW